jgi:hypothetical protein
MNPRTANSTAVGLMVAASASILASAFSMAQPPSGPPAAPPKYSPDVPAKITTSDTVETPIGTLRFKDGAPDPATVQLAYDQLDFGRGIDAFLRRMSATSVYAACRGMSEVGAKVNQGIGITADLVDARSLFLTPNTTTVYVVSCIDLKDGPMVVRVPPRVLGPADDADFRWVIDVGLTGPDRGAGGDYLFVPPGYTGKLPAKGYYVARPRTNLVALFYRAFVEKGDIAAAVAGVKAKAAIFPLSQAAKPPAVGSAYAGAFRDATGNYLDGGRTYKVTLPGPIPAKNFWAFTVYDNQTRSLLPTDQKLAGVDSTLPGIQVNQDGGATVWFGPSAPAGHDKNWVQTMPGNGYNVMRLYGPLEPWFNQTWRPGDLEVQP